MYLQRVTVIGKEYQPLKRGNRFNGKGQAALCNIFLLPATLNFRICCR